MPSAMMARLWLSVTSNHAPSSGHGVGTAVRGLVKSSGKSQLCRNQPRREDSLTGSADPTAKLWKLDQAPFQRAAASPDTTRKPYPNKIDWSANGKTILLSEQGNAVHNFRISTRTAVYEVKAQPGRPPRMLSDSISAASDSRGWTDLLAVIGEWIGDPTAQGRRQRPVYCGTHETSQRNNGYCDESRSQNRPDLW